MTYQKRAPRALSKIRVVHRAHRALPEPWQVPSLRRGHVSENEASRTIQHC